jgi:hypothetical protein
MFETLAISPFLTLLMDYVKQVILSVKISDIVHLN